MNHFKCSTFAALAVLLLVSFSACNKDEDPPVQPDNTAAFSAKVNGKTWLADTISAVYTNGRLMMIANAADGSRIALAGILSATGNYSLSGYDQVCIYDPGPGDAPGLSYYASGQANQLVISKFNLADALVSGQIDCLVKDATTNRTDTLSVVTFTNIKIAGLPPQSQQMSATTDIPGYSGFLAFAFVNGTTNNNIALNLLGADATSELVLYLGQNINPGFYSLGSVIGGGSHSAAVVLNTSNLFDCIGGSVQVIAHDKAAKKISGIYYYNAVSYSTFETAQITGGQFSLAY